MQCLAPVDIQKACIGENCTRIRSMRWLINMLHNKTSHMDIETEHSGKMGLIGCT